MTPSMMIASVFDSASTGSTVEYRVLSRTTSCDAKPLPLILHLHGAMSSAAFLEIAKPIYDAAWAAGVLPPAVVACASTPTLGGFYIDHPSGPAWEQLIGTEFPEHLATRTPLSETRAVVGFSMGGYGALKLAFRQPGRYRAVAALCPAIFPAETSADVRAHNLNSILGELNIAMGRSPDQYTENCIQAILRRNSQDIASSAMQLFLECGASDEFGLHDGAMHLHRLLAKLGIDHVWDSAPGVGHADAVSSRLAKALAFLGQYLT